MLIPWRDDDEDTHDGGTGGDHHKKYPEVYYVEGRKSERKEEAEQPQTEEVIQAPFSSPILDRQEWIDNEITALMGQLASLAKMAEEIGRLEQLRRFQALGDLYDKYLSELRAAYSRSLDEDFFFLLLLAEEA